MNSKLYKLLMEYRGLDDNFINQAFDIIMEDEESLEPFVNDFLIVNNQGNSLGSYDYNDGIITVNKKAILNSDVYNKKIEALKIIRHELEHVRSIQRLHECRDDIESTVIRYSLKDYATEHGLDSWDPFDKNDYFSLFYRGRRSDNYELDPGERIAEIKACKYVVNLLKNQRNTPDLLEARKQLYCAYMRGYKSNGWYLNPPTYEFLLNMGMYHEYYLFKKRVEERQYVFDTRLMYGLPLCDGKEYDEKVLKKVLLQKSKRQ